MKNLILSLLTLFSLSLVSYGQDQSNDTSSLMRRCYTPEKIKQLKQTLPGLDQARQKLEVQTQQWIKENATNQDSKTTITIPVVVHILWNTTAQNISDSRVYEQITVLNRDFSGQNPHSMGAFSSSLKANTGIQFCLASVDPNGNPTSGIDRKQTTKTVFNSSLEDMKQTSTGGVDAWDVSRYLNIWVCNIQESDGLGYAIPPYVLTDYPDYAFLFGLVIKYSYFGVTGTPANYNGGGTTSHEIAHCFNLNHIWGDDEANANKCSGSDEVEDTPNQAIYTSGAPTGVKTDACSPSSPGIMYMNFMDYSYDVAYANFTPGQAARMQACFAAGGVLESLKNSTVGCNVGVKEEIFPSDVNIYPNPTQGLINIEMELASATDIRITVYNSLGAVVTSFEKTQTHSFQTAVDLISQPAGIYYLTIQSNSQSITKKISFFN